jgi:GTP cyclohydrolase I
MHAHLLCQVAEAVEALTGAAGVMVVARAAHMCMVARGVQNHGGSTISTAVRGCYVGFPELRIKCLHNARMQQDVVGPK